MSANNKQPSRRLSRHWHANNLRAANIPAELHAAVSALCTKAYELGKEAATASPSQIAPAVDAGLIQRYMIAATFPGGPTNYYMHKSPKELPAEAREPISSLQEAIDAFHYWKEYFKLHYTTGPVVVSIVAIVRMDDIITGSNSGSSATPGETQ